MRTTEHVFEAEGSRFYVVVTVGGRNGVVIALPDFRWSQSMSDHRAPSGAWLRSAGLKNKVDADSLSAWLTANWTALVGNEGKFPQDPAVLVLVGRHPNGKSTLAGRIAGAFGTVRVFDGLALAGGADHFQVAAVLASGGFVVVTTNEEPHPNIVEGWAKFGTVHVVRYDGSRP